MSHPVNDEILERLYEEVFEERSISPECDDPVILFDINKEVRKRSEEEEYQLPPLSEEEEAEHDAAWMRQMERMCCED